jgi:hypothetical protein
MFPVQTSYLDLMIEKSDLEVLPQGCPMFPIKTSYLDLMIDEPGLGGFPQGGQMFPPRFLIRKRYLS